MSKMYHIEIKNRLYLFSKILDNQQLTKTTESESKPTPPPPVKHETKEPSPIVTPTTTPK